MLLDEIQDKSPKDPAWKIFLIRSELCPELPM